MSTFSDDTDAALAAERGFDEAALLTAKNTIDGLRADLGDRDIRIASLEAGHDALQSEFDAYRAAHPATDPPPTGALIGATGGGTDGGLNITADVRRCYDLSGSGAQEAVRRCRNGGVVWGNYKGQISDAALRTELQALSNLLTTKSQTGIVTYEHEPDIKDVIAPSVYHAGYDQLERIIVEFPTLKPRVCMTGFTGDKDPTVWETYWRPGHDVIGFDHYNRGHQQTGKPLLTPAENWGPLLAFAKSKDKKAAIAETGARVETVPGPVIKTRADWYRAHRAFALDPANNLVAVCAFDSGLGLLDPASAHAWYGA